MKSKKHLTYITLFVSVLSLVLIYVSHNVKKFDSIYYDIALAFLGSAALGFIMSITEYFVEKKKAMEEFWFESINLLKKLSTIEYIDIDVPIDLLINCFNEEQNNNGKLKIKSTGTQNSQTHKDELIKWFKENDFSICDDELNNDILLDEYYISKMTKYRKVFDTYMDIYRNLNLLDTVFLDNAYGNLDFLIFGNKGIRKEMYYGVYQKIKNIISEIHSEVYHFNLLSSSNGNYAICISKLKELNDKFFDVKKVVDNKNTYVKVYKKDIDDIKEKLEMFRCKIYNQKYIAKEKKPVLCKVVYLDEN